MSVHELKTTPVYFRAIVSGRKTFEVRKNDRGYRFGDTLRLREWNAEADEYTGREIAKIVSYVLTDDFPGLQPGWVAMGFKSEGMT